VRLVALVAVRNECSLLPGWLRNVAPHVDGIIGLDDGSADDSGERLAASPEVHRVIRNPVGRPRREEMADYRRLVQAAVEWGADWAISLDADERLEWSFRSRVEAVMRREMLSGRSAYSLRLRELWDSRRHYRVDGIWGRKSVARLFRLAPGQPFEDRRLHGSKVPAESPTSPRRRVPVADLELYHLAMLTPESRRARREKYERLDPDERWQPRVGYSYLTDESGLELSEVPAQRAFFD